MRNNSLPRLNLVGPKERYRRRGLSMGADAGAKGSTLFIGQHIPCKRPLHNAVTPQLQRRLVTSAPHCTAKKRIVLGRELCESHPKEVLVCEMDHCQEPVGRTARSWRLNDAGTPSYACRRSCLLDATDLISDPFAPVLS
jgi:hypothetical protein